MKEARILRIVVASPGDVQAERDLLPGIIDELNRGIAADRGLRLTLKSLKEPTARPGHSNRTPAYRSLLVTCPTCERATCAPPSLAGKPYMMSQLNQ